MVSVLNPRYQWSKRGLQHNHQSVNKATKDANHQTINNSNVHNLADNLAKTYILSDVTIEHYKRHSFQIMNYMVSFISENHTCTVQPYSKPKDNARRSHA
jgi:hypothetical protein